jgi:hypothetical protein
MKVEQTLFFSSTNSATADAGLFERQTEIHCCDWAKWTARTPLLDQNADRKLAKSSRAFQIELSETLTPLPDVSGAGTLVAAVPVQRDRRSMSRRP